MCRGGAAGPVTGPVFKTGEPSFARRLVGSTPMRLRQFPLIRFGAWLYASAMSGVSYGVGCGQRTAQPAVPGVG